jgi:hypothetical protein
MVIKTYLINDNGIIRFKEHNHLIQKNYKPKKTLDDIKNNRNMSSNISINKLTTVIPTNLSETEFNSMSLNKKTSIRIKYFARICEIIGINKNPLGSSISFDKLNDPHTIKELYKIQFDLRIVFPSDKLTSLHSCAIKKQIFPGVNIVRQIFKEMGFKLKPVNYSDGYLGNKKLLRREYYVQKI